MFCYIILFLFIPLLFWIYKNTKLYYKTIVDNTINIVLVNKNGKIIDANKRFFEYFGYSSLKDFNKEHNCICEYFVDDEDGFISQKIDGEDWFEYLYKNQHKLYKAKLNINGTIYYFKVGITKLSNKSNSYAIVLADITKEIEVYKKVEKLTKIDPLTQIGNRREFFESLESFKKLSDRYGRVFSLIMFDIDNFKQINDSFGHDVGDKVLKEYAKLIKSTLRDSDIFCRTGGEEFGIILPEITLDDAIKVAQKIRKKVESANLVVPITISLGVVEYKTNETIDNLYARADRLLYKAKRNGKNKVES